MKAMRDYQIRVIIRANGNGLGNELEHKYALAVRAFSDLDAHRAALEHAWQRGWLVSRFVSVQPQPRKQT